MHGNQFSKIINSEMVILTPITINNHFNNANYVTKVDHLCSERHTFNFLLKKVDFRATHGNSLTIRILYDKMKCTAVRIAESAKLRFPGSNPGDASRKAPVVNVGGLIIREQRIKNK